LRLQGEAKKNINGETAYFKQLSFSMFVGQKKLPVLVQKRDGAGHRHLLKHLSVGHTKPIRHQSGATPEKKKGKHCFKKRKVFRFCRWLKETESIKKKPRTGGEGRGGCILLNTIGESTTLLKEGGATCFSSVKRDESLQKFWRTMLAIFQRKGNVKFNPRVGSEGKTNQTNGEEGLFLKGFCLADRSHQERGFPWNRGGGRKSLFEERKDRGWGANPQSFVERGGRRLKERPFGEK